MQLRMAALMKRGLPNKFQHQTRSVLRLRTTNSYIASWTRRCSSQTDKQEKVAEKEPEETAEPVKNEDDHAEELERLRSEIELWKGETARIQADAYNNAERLKREKKNADTYAIRTFSKALLPVVDVLERALEQDNATAEQMLEGIKLTHKQFLSCLEKHNVHKVPTTGVFSPNLHEVVFQQPSEEPSGTILQVLTTGYKIGDQTLRGAKVSISSGPAEEKKE